MTIFKIKGENVGCPKCGANLDSIARFSKTQIKVKCVGCNFESMASYVPGRKETVNFY